MTLKTCLRLALAVSVGSMLAAAPLALKPDEWIPYKDRKAHQCGTPCRCGCVDGKPCHCDGRTCPVDILGHDGKAIRLDIGRENLPDRKALCLNRPLSEGPTQYRDGLFWSCNDPKCFGCNPD